MEESSRTYTAFSVGNIDFYLIETGFGFFNARSSFQRLMKKNIYIYLISLGFGKNRMSSMKNNDRLFSKTVDCQNTIVTKEYFDTDFS